MNANFTGRRRSGKTTLAFYLALKGGGGIVVFDPKREFREWPDTVTSLLELEAKAKRGKILIVYHPQGDTDAEFTLVGEWIIRQHELAMAKGWDKKGFHFTLIYDEAHNSQGPNWANPKLLQILSQNRPEILNVFQTFQSPKDAFNRLKSRVSDWFIFSTNLPSDIDYLQKELGVTPEDAARIQAMGDYEYAHFYFDGGKPVADFGQLTENEAPDLFYTEKEGDEMEREEKDDKRDKKPQYPLQVESDADIYQAYNMINRRKKDDPKSKYRGRSTDRASEDDERDDRGGNKKVFKIGDWSRDKAS